VVLCAFRYIAPKKPNSAKRRAAKIRLEMANICEHIFRVKVLITKISGVLIRGSGAPDLPVYVIEFFVIN